MNTRKELIVFLLVLVLGCAGGEGIKGLFNNEEIRKVYYESGKLKAEWHYQDGKREGISRGYYESGGVLMEWNYQNDKLEDISRQ